MHRVLERQLRRHFGSPSEVPDDLRPLLDAVDQAYQAADEDRSLLERSLDLTSDELLERNQELQDRVADLERTQAELSRSRERYRRIVETASEGMLLLDPEETVVFANRMAAEMLQSDLEDLVGSPAARFLGNDWGAGHHEPPGPRSEIEVRRADGQPLWVLVGAAPWPSPDRRDGRLLMLTDVTARRTAEDRLRRAYGELQELVEHRTQFINITAHELATPLTPIILQIDILKRLAEGKVEDRVWNGLTILERNLERLSNLTADVLDAARIQAHRMRIDRERFDLATAIQECVASYEAFAGQKDVRIEVRLDDELPVLGDPHRLAQVLVNLLSNAIKFSPPDSTVRVTAERADGEARVYVTDAGIGVRPEDVPRLFQPFAQVHDAAERSEGGTGLGLYVSRGILEEHDGRIWCQSQGQGSGATFGFAVPLAIDAEEAAAEAVGSASET